MSNKILVVGASGHAKVIVETVVQEDKYTVAGLLDNIRQAGDEVLGFPVLGSEENLRELIERYSIHGLLIAIGDNFQRSQMYERLSTAHPQLEMVSAIHPQASVSPSAVYGPGTVIMAGAVVNAESRIGKCCIVNTRASLDHDCHMSDFSSIAPGVAVGGSCKIGRRTSVGIGAVLKHGVSLGDDTVVGAGAVVLNSFGDEKVVFGVPAREIRGRSISEAYL